MPKPTPANRPPAPNFGLSARSTISELAATTLLDVLTGNEIAVYLRLLTAAHHQGKRRVAISNAELHRGRHSKNVSIAIKHLAESGLVQVHNAGTLARTIEVLK